MLDGVVTCVATIHFNSCGLMPVSHLFNFSVSESKVTMSVPLAPPPPPQSVNLDRLGEVLKNQMMPVLNGFKAQVEEQLRKSSEAEEESRQALKVELLGEHNRLQKRVGTMLQSDLKRRASDSLAEEVAEDDGSESESVDGEDFTFFKAQKMQRFAPAEEETQWWAEARRMSESFGDDDWKKVKVTRLVDFYSGHAEAKVFKALEADPEVGIRFDSEKNAEKHSKEMESLVSAAAGALTRAMSSITSVRSFFLCMMWSDLLFRS